VHQEQRHLNDRNVQCRPEQDDDASEFSHRTESWCVRS
jgi:hypothetical protein